MPELPEVDYMVRHLRTIPHDGFIWRVATWHKKFEALLPNLNHVLGQEIKGWYRKAKYIICELDNGNLIIHNKFTGYLSSEKYPFVFDYLEFKRQTTLKDLRLALHVERTGGEESVIDYHDARCLGLVVYEDRPVDQIPYLMSMGPDVVITPTTHTKFVKPWTYENLSRSLGTSKPVKLMLLDQTQQAGIGNIYACEALHRTRISPERPSNKITEAEAWELHTNVQLVMNLGLTHNVKYDNYIKVFRQAKCSMCDGPVTRTEQAKRGSYWCTKCQV